MPWFENLNRAYQFLVVVGGFMAILGGVMGVAGAISTRIIDAMIRQQVEPVRDMSEFGLRASGQWDAFIEFREKKDRERKAIDGRRASRIQIEPWQRIYQ